jgi:hypothetical protein
MSATARDVWTTRWVLHDGKVRRLKCEYVETIGVFVVMEGELRFQQIPEDYCHDSEEAAVKASRKTILNHISINDARNTKLREFLSGLGAAEVQQAAE